MAHLKDLVVNGNSRTLGTSYATNYSGKWEGISNDVSTENTSDTWVPVLAYGVLQHRVIPAAYNNDPSTLSVNYAKTSGTANNVAWGGVTGKPATYTPSAHTHDDRYYTKSEVDGGLNNRLALIGGTMSGSLAFSEIGDVGTSAGLHWSGSTDGASIYYQTTASDQGNLVLNMFDDDNTTIRFDWNGTNKAYISSDGVYHGTATYANSAGSANSVAWGGVTGKPATYTPASHTHAISDISNLQNTINSINSNKADLKYLNDNFYSVSSIDNKVNTINSAIGGKYSSNGGTLNGDLSFPDIGDTDSSKGIVWGGSTDGAKIYYKTAAADKGQLVLHMDDDSDTTINFEWTADGGVSTKSYISSDGVYHGTATYANSAGSANNVAWANISGKPSITYYADESNLPSEYTGANVWKSPS